MSKEIQNSSSKDVTFNSNGEGYITQRSFADALNVSKDVIYRWVKSNRDTLKLNNCSQLHESEILNVARAITKNHPHVIDIVKKIEIAGSRAWLHYRDGDKLYAHQALSQYDQLRLTADLLEAQAKLLETKADKGQVDDIDKKVVRMEKAIRNTQCPKGYLPKYKLAEFLGVAMNSNFDRVLAQVRSVEYPYTNGRGGVQPKMATAYHIEEVRLIVET